MRRKSEVGGAQQGVSEPTLQAAVTKYRTRGGFSNKTLISHSSGGWEVQDQVASKSGPYWGPPSWLADDHLLSVSWDGRGRKLWCVFSYRHDSYHGGFTLITSTTMSIYQRPHLLMLSHWGLGFQHTNFEETPTFSPISPRRWGQRQHWAGRRKWQRMSVEYQLHRGKVTTCVMRIMKARTVTMGEENHKEEMGKNQNGSYGGRLE